MGIKLPGACLALVSAALLTACGTSKEDLKGNPFYEKGDYASFVLTEDSLDSSRPYKDCQGGFTFLYPEDPARQKPGRKMPKTDEDKAAFMAGCEAGVLKKAGQS
ncbi:hypothetical protein [Nonomuraea jabiensis]|uniref:hypothetical protein n=1 Tax=Nonomuraea jabiensis TaxID=882448 RepID=UPI003D70CC08